LGAPGNPANPEVKKTPELKTQNSGQTVTKQKNKTNKKKVARKPATSTTTKRAPEAISSGQAAELLSSGVAIGTAVGLGQIGRRGESSMRDTRERRQMPEMKERTGPQRGTPRPGSGGERIF
jgi:hypothetical protein